MKFSRILPCLRWLRVYDKRTLTSDLVAALIVTIMLIPQSLAYALLAGLPPETGLYASILPLVAYALFGTSMTMAVGPVAVISLMTAAAAGKVAASGLMSALEAAILLAWISGIFLLLLGVLRVGFVANFLSHPVVAGFIAASGIIIALGQLKHLLGIQASGDTLPELLITLSHGITGINPATVAIGGGSLLFLVWARSGLKSLLQGTTLSPYTVNVLVRIAPVVTVIITALLAWQLRLDQHGVALMGAIPAGLPQLQLPAADLAAVKQLLLPAMMLSIIGYVESVSVGKTLAARRRQKINPDQELIALGTTNIASGLSGGFPVTGGFSRSVVNFDAGAQTPAASFFTAIGIGIATLLFTGFLAWLPNATLAATIMIAVLGLVDLSVLRRTWAYSRSDFIAVATTMGVTLMFGVEIGVSCGVGASLMLHLYKTSRPHIAEVGEVPGTEHFRNVKRHQVITHPEILTLRIDESLYFANASYIEDQILAALAERQKLKHVILMCTAVNEIDISALEVLEGLIERLRELGIGFHLSEVKGPVMDALAKTHFVQELNGQIFLSQHQAVATLLAR